MVFCQGKRQGAGEEYCKTGEEKGEKDLPRRRERLSHEREIKEILNSKQYSSKGPLLSFVARENFMPISRIAVITPSNIGKATKRNRLRRVFAESFARIKHKIAKNVDLVVFPGRDAINIKFITIVKAFKAGLRKSRLLENVDNY